MKNGIKESIVRFIKAWFYYSTYRDYLYQEGILPAQTRFQYAKKQSKRTFPNAKRHRR